MRIASVAECDCLAEAKHPTGVGVDVCRRALDWAATATRPPDIRPVVSILCLGAALDVRQGRRSTSDGPSHADCSAAGQLQSDFGKTR
eukprot:scaffold34542_cov37-Prasinocladus_malaysianus.AAC.1